MFEEVHYLTWREVYVVSIKLKDEFLRFGSLNLRRVAVSLAQKILCIQEIGPTKILKVTQYL